VERVHRTARHFHGGGVKASHQPVPVGPEDHVTIHLTVIGIHELHRDDDAPSKARLSVLKVWVSGGRSGFGCHPIEVSGPRHYRDIDAERLRDLNGERPDPARASVDQNLLSGPELTVVPEPLKRRYASHGNRSGFLG
jgi:hypothetical protein